MACRAVINFLYDKCWVALTTCSILLYVGHFGQWDPYKVYIVAPATVAAILILTVRLMLALYDWGVINTIMVLWGHLLQGTIYVWGVTVQIITINKITLVIWLVTSVGAFVLLADFIWINVDMFRILRECLETIRCFIVYISDPGAIMASVQNLLRTLRLLDLLNWLKESQLYPMLARINEGDISVIPTIFFKGCVGFVVGLIPYLIYLIISQLPLVQFLRGAA